MSRCKLRAIQIISDTLRGVETESPNGTGERGGSKIGQKSVTYYLNGPLDFTANGRDGKRDTTTVSCYVHSQL